MRLIRLTEEYIEELIAGRIGVRGPQLESCSLALGSFDGLHRGHQKLISRVRAGRQEHNLASGAVFTFIQHPRQTLSPHSDPYLLTTWREKLALLEDLGCEVIVAADFCPALSRLDYKTFVSRFLVGYLGMKHLVAGYDVHLGANRGGTASTLADLGGELGFSVEVVPPVKWDEKVISSTAIRKALGQGRVEDARQMLGRPYSLWGEVVPGDRRGREIGYPTANVQPFDDLKLLPEPGVYAVTVQVPAEVASEVSEQGTGGILGHSTETLPEIDSNGDLLGSGPGQWVVFGGMLNFGFVPTFHTEGLTIPRLEANIFGFDGDLRGRNVKIQWHKRLRGERKFEGRDDLIRQLALDEAEAREILGC
ncbi:MAG: bifunctional riboflavin kinase/FMN adenylyltransferase [Gemmatimonadales bacterium]|nr:bifunctional riboflavin kinase/FMN adenylyltransferase [Gemmatimonadales bacterium]